MKNHCRDKSKVKTFVLVSIQDSKLFNKARKSRKRKQNRDRQDSTNPDTGVNKAKVGGRRKKDINEITCYNCNKKGYFVTKCLKPWKSKN